MKSQEEQICCPVFDPSKWDDKEMEWNNKLFVKDTVSTFFFMPLNFGSVMKRLDKKVRLSDAQIVDYLFLSDHISKWKMDLYVAVDKEVRDAENVKLSGKFLSKVYEGKYSETGKWCDDYKNFAKRKGFDIKKWFMWYTTCPKCAKKYGKNYVVIIAKVE